MRRRFLALFPLLIAAVLAAFRYFSAEKVTNPETGRSVRVAMSPDQEQALGLHSYREVLAQSEVVTSGPELELVGALSGRAASRWERFVAGGAATDRGSGAHPEPAAGGWVARIRLPGSGRLARAAVTGRALRASGFAPGRWAEARQQTFPALAEPLQLLAHG